MTLDDASVALPAFARRVDAGIELRLKVIPGASCAAMAGALGDRLKVRVVAAPKDGKANRAVIVLLETWLKSLIPQNNASVELVSGHASPLKTVLLRGVTALPPFDR
jgi:uncharacterized protein